MSILRTPILSDGLPEVGGGMMRILSFITDPPLVDKILRHASVRIEGDDRVGVERLIEAPPIRWTPPN